MKCFCYVQMIGLLQKGNDEGECASVALTIDQALDIRDSLAQLLYQQLFEWILHRINATTTNGCNHSNGRSSGGGSFATITLVDHHGFERSGSMNGFEQFCINLYSERLEWYYQQK
ncbi:unnamed protein product, partial [Gongylonema pulchrum]|uniref:Myosin motor domain-containing protein n=1 Tax=Gongylonema pulchrum TaxID=637853 RepID=A0A183ENW5_9BILA